VIDRAIGLLGARPPRVLVRFAARRHVAGPKLVDALRFACVLENEGKRALIAPLGEDARDAGEAARYAEECLRLLTELSERGMAAATGLKLSALGLGLDEELCLERLVSIVGEARARETDVFIDMERSGATDATLRLYKRLREQGLENVVVSLQARLLRTADDLESLAPLAPRISLCKGAYAEPAELVHRSAEAVRDSYLSLLERLIESASFIGIASADRPLIAAVRRLLREREVRSERYEFQLLLGSSSDLADDLVRSGEPVRVYVPYGERWYDYTLRRLRREG
jgi:proline dehydrogenase